MAMLKDVYLGDWDKLEEVLHDFNVGKAAVEGYKVIVACYNTGSYEGDAFVLLKKGRKYYEVNASHCSCYGLEGQFDFEETEPLALKKRCEAEYRYGAFASCCDTLKQHFRW
jgi:hypothetical protein